jgi:ADP-ribose pyrophosphatase
MDIEVVNTETVYCGKVFNIRKDFLRLPGDRQVQIDVVDHLGSVTILPVDEQGLVWFIRQYRHPVGDFLLELPAGVSKAGEDPQICAQRELREEIGMAAKQMHELGSFYLAPGYSTEFMHVFLANELYPSPLPKDLDEIIEVEKISTGDALNLADSGNLQDSKSLIALLWARPLFLKLGLI